MKQSGSYLFLLFIFILLNSCQKKFLCPDCIDNKPPVANAGIDQAIVLPRDSTILDGSNSTDPDGKIISYKWSVISGPFISTIVDPVKPQTMVKGLVTGIYRFELLVTDDMGASDKDTILITVNNAGVGNQPPVANAGTDQVIVIPRDSALLNGSLSMDPDGSIVSYQWKKISGPVSGSFRNSGAVQTWIWGLDTGTYVFQLKVIDNGGLSAMDTVQIKVNPSAGTKSPVANAGADANVNLDFQNCTSPLAVTLNGSASADPDGTIVSWSWTKLNPDQAFIVSPAASVTQVTYLVAATYKFRLEVTDNSGLTDDDTVVITISGNNRQEIPASLIPIGTLSKTRYEVSMASAGNKILFAGGVEYNGTLNVASSRVDIYNYSTNTWTTAELSQARYQMATVVSGNKIFFAGGLNGSPNSISTVDIYDVVTDTWSVAHLSQGRAALSAAAAGNKVLFAGGFYFLNNFGDLLFSSVVDIYDVSTNTWSTSSLSIPRGMLTATAAGNKIYFAGGVTLANPSDYTSTDKIDIYDVNPGTWSSSQLSEGKGEHAAVAVNNKIYWAGGAVNAATNTFSYVSRMVEIKDLNTNTSSFACLFQPNADFEAVSNSSSIIFFRGTWGNDQNKFDIYDLSSNTWKIGVFSQTVAGSILSANNNIYLAGAYVNGVITAQVYKLVY